MQWRNDTTFHRRGRMSPSGRCGHVQVASAMARAEIDPPSTGDDPGRIEPPVRRAVIGEPRDVPMADERGVGSPDRRSSTDVDHAVGIAGNHVWRLLARAYRDDGAVLVGKSRNGAIGPGPEQDDVATRQLEETPDIRRVFRALRAFPRHAPVQAELTAPTDGAHGPYIGHRLRLPALLPAARQCD